MRKLVGRVLEHPFLLNWLPVLAWMVAILIVPHVLRPSLPDPGTPSGERSRRGFHVVEYGVLTLLIKRALRRSSRDELAQRGAGWRPHLLAAAMALLFSVFDEGLQAFMPHREAAAADLAANGLGVLLALASLSRGESRLETSATNPDS